MNPAPPPVTAAPATLQTVLDRLAGDGALSDTRKRDLRSAVTSYAKLRAEPPAAIPLDLPDIRRTLDGMVPSRAKISRKRWANLRSGLAAAIQASALRPMLKTRDLDLDEAWSRLLASADRRLRHGLSRFARWVSFYGIRPEAVDESAIKRFLAELDGATLVRNLRDLPRTVARSWNALAELHHAAGLRPVAVPPSRAVRTRVPWQRLPASFREDVEQYLTWASMPDPLAEGARARALAPLSLGLQVTHIHSAVTAAAAAGIPLDQLTSLATLVEPETYRSLLRHRWREDGGRLGLHPWRRHHLDRDRFGMGKGVAGRNCSPQGSAEQARGTADRPDR